jgi:hypothetical protein
MLKAIFGFLGLLIVLSMVGSLMKHQLGALGQIGQITTRVQPPAGIDGAAAGGGVAGRAVGGQRLDGFAATAGAEVPTAQQQIQSVQKSVFAQQDEAMRKSVDRYKRVDP